MFTQSFGSPKHQNGFVAQASYGQMTPMMQGGWNLPPNQSLYNLPGMLNKYCRKLNENFNKIM